MDKELIYENIKDMIENGYYLSRYKELTEDINLDNDDEREETLSKLEEISANIFNSILISCQLFDDEEKRVDFANSIVGKIDSYSLSYLLQEFNIPKEEACKKLMHGFGVHFTTPKICDEIVKNGELKGYGKNAMFTKEEDQIITEASKMQKANNKEAEQKMLFLYRGWGTGSSSYGSITNSFWMYHTPESLSFLFGDISSRDKDKAMSYVSKCISDLDEDRKKATYNTMSNLWDRLVGNEQEAGCVLIDRDAFNYPTDYYYNTNPPTAVQRRPYSGDTGLSSLESNDNKITDDIPIENLKILKVPTVMQLERLKNEQREYK